MNCLLSWNQQRKLQEFVSFLSELLVYAFFNPISTIVTSDILMSFIGRISHITSSYDSRGLMTVICHSKKRTNASSFLTAGDKELQDLKVQNEERENFYRDERSRTSSLIEEKGS